MAEPQYPGARAVAARMQAYFAAHIASAAARGDTGPGAAPDEPAIAALIDAAFWASLRREEGLSPTISLAMLPPAASGLALRFASPLPLVPDVLTRLAPAVMRPGVHLAVWHTGTGLAVWGATRSLPPFCLVLEVSAPGMLVIKHRGTREAGKFVNVVVLEGDRVKVIDERSARAPDCPALVASLLGFEPVDVWASASVLSELALSMRAHHRGGTLLVVRAGTTAWQDSVLQPIAYGVVPPFAGLKDVIAEDVAEERRREWGEAYRRVIDGIAGLTAVDGATILTDEYDVLGFGAKIVSKHRAAVDRVLLTEPVEGMTPAVVSPSQLGGTRHLSAAQFAYDQRDALALVASQDGRFTVLGWSRAAEMVQAHRVEALLL